jgi:hypothetical protein
MRPQQAAAPTLAPASDAAPPPPWTFSTRMFGPSTTLCKAEAKDVFPDKYENGRFKHIGTLGRGAFSVVFKVTDSKVGGEVAVKAVQMPKDEQTRKALKKEIEILKQLDYPGIVKLHENVECMDGILHLVMDYYPAPHCETYSINEALCTRSKWCPLLVSSLPHSTICTRKHVSSTEISNPRTSCPMHRFQPTRQRRCLECPVSCGRSAILA